MEYEKRWFWFTIGCHVVYSYLYEDETLGISHDLVVTLESELAKDVTACPKLLDDLRTDFPEIFRYLEGRLLYLANK